MLSEIYKCPSCLDLIGINDPICKKCGFSLSVINSKIGKKVIELQRVIDVLGVIDSSQINILEDKLKEIEKQFPQIAISVIFANLKKFSNIREFGFWVLNHGKFSRKEMIINGSYGTLVIIDLSGKNVSVSIGYYLEKFIRIDDLDKILNISKKYYAERKNIKGTLVILDEFKKLLIERVQDEKRNIENSLSLHSNNFSLNNLWKKIVNK